MTESIYTNKMRELYSDVQGNIAKAEQIAKTDHGFNIQEQYADFQARLEAKAKEQNPETAITDQFKIIEATVQSVREDAKQDTKDLANAVLGLRYLVDEIGGSLDNLEQFSPEEQQILIDAQNTLEAAKRKRNLLDPDMEKAKKKWFFRGSAIKEVQDKIYLADQEIAAAKQALKKAPSLQETKRRERLQNSSMQDSLQDLQYMTAQLIKALIDNVDVYNGRVEATSKKREKSFEEKEAVATLHHQLTKDLDELEIELDEEEQKLVSTPKDDEGYEKQDQKVKDLSIKVEELRGQLNETFAVLNSLEYFCEALTADEIALTKLRDDTKMFIASLQKDTEHRVITFQNQLDKLKGLADMEFTTQIDQIGTKQDQKNLEMSAKVMIASNKARMEKLQAHKPRMEETSKVLSMMAQHIAKDREGLLQIMTEFEEKWGIDKSASHFHTYINEA